MIAAPANIALPERQLAKVVFTGCNSRGTVHANKLSGE